MGYLLYFAAEIDRGCDQFETTIKCQDRLNGMYDRKIGNNLTARDLLSFRLDADCRYNADISSIQCSRAKEWSHELTYTGDYMGVNVFGVKKLIHSRFYETINISTDQEGAQPVLNGVPAETARRIMPYLRVLLIGDPLQPFAKSVRFTSTPTITSPYRSTMKDYTLLIELRQVWLYNIATVEILAKQVVRSITN